MASPLVAVDTSAILWLLDNSEKNEEKRALTELAFDNLAKASARYVVPAPVLAELCRDGLGSEVYKGFIVPSLKRVRVEVLGKAIADVAGQMRRVALKSAGDRPRGAVSYDALIAATAHVLEADYLITGDPVDMKRCLDVINSPVRLLDCTSTMQMQGNQTVMPTVLARPSRS